MLQSSRGFENLLEISEIDFSAQVPPQNFSLPFYKTFFFYIFINTGQKDDDKNSIENILCIWVCIKQFP